MHAPDRNISRRDFIKSVSILIGSLIGMAISVPAIAFLVSPAVGKVEDDAWIELGPLDKYEPGVPTLREFTRTSVNGWERSAIPYGAFVVRGDAANARVFSNVCTHLGCRVSWHADVQHYISPCHDGHFDLSGGNISGPPPRPLDEYATKVEQGKLFILLPPFKRAA